MPGVPPRDRRTGLLIPVAADGLVADFRRRFNAGTVARHLPPHITILFPFAPAEALDGDLRADLATHFGAFEPFEAKLTRVGSFDGYVWLAPEPRERFVELIVATCGRYPAFPPYEGEGGEPEPHLTVAATSKEEAGRIVEIARSELSPQLPFRFSVTSVSLFEEQADGTFDGSAQFELG